MPHPRSRLALLASGGGTNFLALADYLDSLGDRRGGEIVVVASDRPAAHALERARTRGIPTRTLRTRANPEGAELGAVLDEFRVDLVVLAGYLRLVPSDVVHRWAGRIVNVHPALLPAFGGAGMYGQRVHQAVLDAGVKVTGVSVHFVDEHYDRGTIIAQWPVPVLAGDDATTLAARVLRVEHLLFPRAVDAVAAGRITAERCRAGHLLSSGAAAAFTLGDVDDDCLADAITRSLDA